MSLKHVFASVAHTIGLGSAAASAAVDMDVVQHDVWRQLGDSDTLDGNEQLVVAIRALIAAVFNTRSRIVGAAMRLGLNRGHAAAVLGKSEGSEWRCDADGVYRL